MPAMPGTVPEGSPQHAYIATGPNPNNFLSRAKSFHEAYDFDVVSVGSLQAVVDDLSKRKGIKDRLRIVTHADFVGLTFSMFRGGPVGTEIPKAWLLAFARNDVDGLSSVLGSFVNFASPSGATGLQNVLAALRSADPASLVPFTLEATGTPTGFLRTYFQRNVELLSLGPAELPDADKRLLSAAIEFILDARRADGLRRRVRIEAGVDAASVRRLGSAIQGLNLPVTINALDPDYRANLRAALKAVSRPEPGRFRTRLNQAREHLGRNSVIDIRGCHAGSDEDYLRAIATFFAHGNIRPHVTGPDLFQSFPTPRSLNMHSNAEVAEAAMRPEVAKAFEHWANVTGQPQVPQNLLSYLDRFLLPIPISGLQTEDVETLIFGQLDPGSSGFRALTDFLDSLWLAPPSNVASRLRGLRRTWSRSNQASPVAVLSDASSSNQTFISPDPQYARHIKDV